MELMRVYRSSTMAGRSLLSFQELRALSAHVCPDETTLCLALIQLQREKQVTVSLHEGEKVRPPQSVRPFWVRLCLSSLP